MSGGAFLRLNTRMRGKTSLERQVIVINPIEFYSSLKG